MKLADTGEGSVIAGESWRWVRLGVVLKLAPHWDRSSCSYLMHRDMLQMNRSVHFTLDIFKSSASPTHFGDMVCCRSCRVFMIIFHFVAPRNTLSLYRHTVWQCTVPNLHILIHLFLPHILPCCSLWQRAMLPTIATVYKQLITLHYQIQSLINYCVLYGYN